MTLKSSQNEQILNLTTTTDTSSWVTKQSLFRDGQIRKERGGGGNFLAFMIFFSRQLPVQDFFWGFFFVYLFFFFGEGGGGDFLVPQSLIIMTLPTI